METLWDRLKHGLLEGAVTVAQQAERLSYAGRVRLDIANDRRLVQSAFADLGRRVYDLISGDGEVAKDSAVLDLIRRIREREEILREREAAFVSLMKAGSPAGEAENAEK